MVSCDGAPHTAGEIARSTVRAANTPVRDGSAIETQDEGYDGLHHCKARRKRRHHAAIVEHFAVIPSFKGGVGRQPMLESEEIVGHTSRRPIGVRGAAAGSSTWSGDPVR